MLRKISQIFRQQFSSTTAQDHVSKENLYQQVKEMDSRQCEVTGKPWCKMRKNDCSKNVSINKPMHISWGNIVHKDFSATLQRSYFYKEYSTGIL